MVSQISLPVVLLPRAVAWVGPTLALMVWLLAVEEHQALGGLRKQYLKAPRPYVAAAKTLVAGEVVQGPDCRSYTRAFGSPEPKSVQPTPRLLELYTPRSVPMNKCAGEYCQSTTMA